MKWKKLNCGALGSLARDVISGLRVWERGLLSFVMNTSARIIFFFIVNTIN